MGEELLAGEVAFLYAVLGELCHHFGFGCNCGMVGAGNPQGVFAFSSCTAYEDVLNRVVKHVAHVKDSGNVGRWNHYGIGLSFIGY